MKKKKNIFIGMSIHFYVILVVEIIAEWIWVFKRFLLHFFLDKWRSDAPPQVEHESTRFINFHLINIDDPKGRFNHMWWHIS